MLSGKLFSSFKVLPSSLNHSTASKGMVGGDVRVPLQKRIIWNPQDYTCQTHMSNTDLQLLSKDSYISGQRFSLLSSKKSIRQSCILKTLKTEQRFSGCESHFLHRLNSEVQPTTKIREIGSITYTSGPQMAEASFQTAHWVLWIQLVCPGNPKSVPRYLICEELDV